MVRALRSAAPELQLTPGAEDGLTGERRTLYVARHGVTQANLDGINEGLEAEPLIEAGREQARALARRVAGLGLTEVWTSPLARARQTAEIVAAAHGLPLHVEPDLRELDPGPWQGLTQEQMAERDPEAFAAWQADPAAFRLPGRETLEQVRARAVAALERIRARDGLALAVTHTVPIRVARVHYAGEELNWFATFLPDHCVLMELAPEGEGSILRAADPDEG
jgi:probable phosphoglycerate mutase